MDAFEILFDKRYLLSRFPVIDDFTSSFDRLLTVIGIDSSVFPGFWLRRLDVKFPDGDDLDYESCKLVYIINK